MAIQLAPSSPRLFPSVSLERPALERLSAHLFDLHFPPEADTRACEDQLFQALQQACRAKKWDKIMPHAAEIAKIHNRAGETLFHWVLKEQDTTAIRELFKKPALVHALDRHGNTALHLAVQTDHPSYLQSLLDAGLDLNARNKDGYTPLDIAYMHGKEVSIKYLCSLGAQGNEALHKLQADSFPSSPLTILTFDKLPDEDDLTHQNRCFELAQEACQGHRWELLDPHLQLLSTLYSPAGQTLFQWALQNCDDTVTDHLLTYLPFVLQIDPLGNTSLHTAAESGATPLIPRLLQHINLDVKNTAGETPLHLAILNGQDAFVQALLHNGASPSLPYPHPHLKNLSPLLLAILRGERECASKLLPKTPNLSSILADGIGTLLHVALQFHQFEMLQHLFEHHPNLVFPLLETPNSQGLTPFLLAASLGETEALLLLKEKGANLEAVDQNGRTAVHHAALTLQPDSLLLLHHFECSLTAFDQDNRHPLQYIEHNPSPEARSFEALLTNLIKKGKIASSLPNFSLRPPENLVFKGGGPKGIAYVGAFRALEEEGFLPGIKRVAGTSAGAITATLVALNYSLKEIEDTLSSTDISFFLDHPLSSSQINPAHLSLLRKIIRAPLQFFKLLGSPFISTGFCEGEEFRRWIEKQLEERTGISHLTFGELRQLIDQGKPFKHLHVFGCKIGDPPQIHPFSSEDPLCDHYIISDTIRISMSIPFAFKAHHIHIKQDGQRLPLKELGDFVDGGVLYNLPIETFDQKRFQTRQNLGPEGLCPQFNKRTLGFTLSSPQQERPPSEPLISTAGILKALVQAYFEAEELIRKLQPYNQYRLISIDPLDVTLLSFSLTDQQKQNLIASGYKATSSFLTGLKRKTHFSPFDLPAYITKVTTGRLSIETTHPHFVGREPLLKLLAGAIPSPWNPSLPLSLKLLVGPSGIGKTELAIAFANHHLEKFSLVWRLHCETEYTFEEDLRQLARILKVYIEKDNFERIREKVYRKLEEGLDKPWLLVFDNVESCIPLPQRGGIAILTTQYSHLYKNHMEQILEVPPLSLPETTALYENIRREKPEPHLLKELYTHLEGWPSLLDVALHALTDYFPLEAYLKSIDDQGPSLNAIVDPERYPKALGPIVTHQLTHLSQVSPPALEFLQLCPYLSPEHIDLSLIQLWGKERGVTSREVIEALEKAALGQFEKGRLRIHRLFQHVIKQNQGQKASTYFAASVDLIHKSVSFEEIEQIAENEKLEPVFMHALQLIESPHFTDSIENAQLCLKVAKWLSEKQGNYSKALEYINKALKMIHDQEEEESLTLAQALEIEGQCFLLMGEFEKGLTSCKRSLDLRQKQLSPESPLIARSLNGIGLCLSDQGKKEEALGYYKQALEIRQKALPPTHPAIAQSLNNIGSCLHAHGNQGKSEEALGYHKQALEIWQTVLSPAHPLIATSLNNIGICLFAQGKNKEALGYYKKALEIRQKALPPGHPDIAASLNNIGYCLYAQGKNEEALGYHKQALEIRQKALPSTHPAIAQSLNGIGSCLSAQGKNEEALGYHKQALEIQKKGLPPMHPDIAQSLNGIGSCLFAQGKNEEALGCHEQALEIRQKALPPTHPAIAFSLNGIGSCLSAQGKNEEALGYHKQALEIQQKALPPEHPVIAGSLNNIKVCQKKLKKCIIL